MEACGHASARSDRGSDVWQLIQHVQRPDAPTVRIKGFATAVLAAVESGPFSVWITEDALGEKDGRPLGTHQSFQWVQKLKRKRFDFEPDCGLLHTSLPVPPMLHLASGSM